MKNINRLLRLLGLLAFLYVSGPQVSAQTEAPQPSYKARSFNPSRLKGYRDNPEYEYLREQPEPLQRKVKEKPRKYERRASPPDIRAPRGDFSGFFKVLVWILIIGAVILVIYQLMKVRFGKLWRKKSDEAVVEVARAEEEVEDIRTLEFDQLLQQAIDQKRYRHAVRLLYLRSLRQMQDKALIQWRREKTNRDYLRELSDQRLRPLFGDLTYMFEYIWYGEFPVDQTHFNVARASFQDFDQAIRQGDAR